MFKICRISHEVTNENATLLKNALSFFYHSVLQTLEIVYSLVSGSMKRQDIVAYFYVRIVKTRWTHMLHPNSRFLTLLRGQNFPSWRTGFNSLLKPQLFIISKYLGGQIKCQGRDHGHLGYLGYFWPIYPHPFWYCGGLAHVLYQSTIICTKN